LLTVEFDFRTRVLAKQDPVAFLYLDGRPLAGIQQLPAAHGKHFRLLRFLFGGIGDDNPSAAFLAFIEALHHDAVVQWTQVHESIIYKSRERWTSDGHRGGEVNTAPLRALSPRLAVVRRRRARPAALQP